MSTSSSSRMSTKARALGQLQRLRDASRDIFRIMQLTARQSKEEGTKERAETLSSNRDNLLNILHQMQGELNESVGELKMYKAHKDVMSVLTADIQKKEAALKQYGAGLQKAEASLLDGLKECSSAGGRPDSMIDVDVDELLRFAHMISYTSSAREGWDSNMPLVGVLPPAPHTAMIAQSRLFSTRRPQDSSASPSNSRNYTALDDGGVGAKRKLEERYVREWTYSKDDESGSKSDAPPEDTSMREPPEKKDEVVIQPLSLSINDDPSKAPASANNALAAANHNHENDAGFLLGSITLPERPRKWRPGDPIVISSQR